MASTISVKATVHAIAFHGESHDGKSYAGDGRGDEEKQAQLNQATAAAVDDASNDSGDGAEIGGLPRKIR